MLKTKTKQRLVTLTVTAILTAAGVVIGRFLSINLPSMTIGLSFVPLILCGMLFGVLWGGIASGLADFTGALLFPFGPYFPGFTATAVISGMIFGAIGRLAEKKQSNRAFALKAGALLILKEAVCSLALNTLFIYILYGTDYFALLLSRLPLSVITLILEVAFVVAVRASVLPSVKKTMER